MITKRLKTVEDLSDAAGLLRLGGLVAVPTETVYGLAGNGLDTAVVEKIYQVKGRPAVKPISLMVPDASRIPALCPNPPEAALTLAKRFWPGPLTLVLKADPAVPEILRAGGETVGLRCPRQNLTLNLLRLLEFPLAVPSANPSGSPSPRDADEVLNYFDGSIDAVIDGGRAELGLESTVLDLSSVPYRILRQGSLPEEEIADALADSLELIGITGGSGSGKTTVLRMLEERGALVLDCDAVYHELLETDTVLQNELENAFPGCLRNGKPDRRFLADAVFRDAEKLQRLNALTGRFILSEIRRRLREWAMCGGRQAVLDAIGLIGSGLAEQCSWTLAVTADTETRIRRIMARDGIDREAAERRIRAQEPDEYFVEHCTRTLSNNGTREELRARFKMLLEEIEKKDG